MSFAFNITNPGLWISGLLTSEEQQFVTELAGLDPDDGDTFIYDSGTESWTVGPGGSSQVDITYSDTAPGSPQDGDLWVDTSVRLDLPVTSADISSIVALTQAEYDALTPVATTLYVITD